MAQMIIDGRPVEFTDEKNILEVVRKTGIELPTLCYQAHLTPFGACRMCVVDAGKRGVVTSCTTPPEDGLAVETNSARVRRVRKMALELMLAAHDRNCLTCDKSGSCKLQDYSERFGIDKVRFHKSVFPGDTLRMEVTMIKDRGRFGKVKITAEVADGLAAEGEFLYALVERETVSGEGTPESSQDGNS
jgi:NADH-quinone oxidoreductase subunit G